MAYIQLTYASEHISQVKTDFQVHNCSASSLRCLSRESEIVHTHGAVHGKS